MYSGESAKMYQVTFWMSNTDSWFERAWRLIVWHLWSYSKKGMFLISWLKRQIRHILGVKNE